MMGTDIDRGAVSAREHRDLDREIAVIVRAVRERGPLSRAEVARAVDSGGWGPLRFRTVLREAVAEGAVAHPGRDVYEANGASEKG
jgi:uncharacterized protein YcaQ